MIKVINVPSRVAHAAFGHTATRKHRMAAGLVVMAVGVTVAKLGSEVHAFHLHFFFDGVGYLIHAIGGIPFLELFERKE